MSKTNPLRPVRYLTDADGAYCALVPLADSHNDAIIYADDLHRLVVLGVSLNWYLNSNGNPFASRGYVKVALPGRDGRVVARLVVGARYKEQVRYRNGDRLDLRRSNLTIVAGGKAHKDCGQLPPTAHEDGNEVGQE